MAENVSNSKKNPSRVVYNLYNKGRTHFDNKLSYFCLKPIRLWFIIINCHLTQKINADCIVTMCHCPYRD